MNEALSLQLLAPRCCVLPSPPDRKQKMELQHRFVWSGTGDRARVQIAPHVPPGACCVPHHIEGPYLHILPFPPPPCRGCRCLVFTVTMAPTGSRALVLTAALTAAALMLLEAQAWSSNVKVNVAHATTASARWRNNNSKHQQHQRRSPRSFEGARSPREGSTVVVGAYNGDSM